MLLNHHSFFTLAFALIVLLASPALAQEAPEKIELSPTQLTYNEEGVKLLGEGDYEGALSKFRSSLRLSEANVTYLNLGRTYQKMGECKRAKEAYGKAADAPPVVRPTPEEIGKVLESYRSELPETCPTSLEFDCSPPSMTVQIDDGEPMPCPADAVDIEPGEHTLTATAFDRTQKKTINVEEGDKVVAEFVIEKQIDGQVAADTGGSVSTEEPLKPRESSSNVWALSLMGVGVAGLATGLIFDLAVLGPAVEAGENPTDMQDYQDNRSTFDTFQVPTLIAYGVGAVAITSGLVWWLVSDSSESAGVSAGPTGDGWAISYGTEF